MSGISTHVLDQTTGKPAVGVSVVLERKTRNAEWQRMGGAVTDADGRARDLTPAGEILAGDHRMTFETGVYFLERNIESFYPEVTIAFTIRDTTQNYHVPLLLSPFGYSTYRGS
jgi:5-hydroxyisourate hydrolase